MRVRSHASGLALALSLGCGACVLHGPGDVRRDLESRTGQVYDKEFGLTLGRAGTAFARWGMRVAGEDRGMLQGVTKVELGIYHPTGGPGAAGGGSPLAASDFPGWFPMVEFPGDAGDGDVLILAKRLDGELRRMLVVVADTDELVIVRLRGKLDAIVEQAMELAFEQADRPELFAPASDAYHASRRPIPRERSEPRIGQEAPAPEETSPP